MIGLNSRPKAKEPTNCMDCKIELDKETKVRQQGVTNRRCRKCHNKYIGEYNKKRQKALKDSKWF